MSVLVIAAHPDDEVLGCGATVARLAAAGESVAIAILGEGVTARSARREDADKAALAALQDKAREAARILGARELVLHGLPDNRFDTVPLLDIVKLVEETIARFQPRTIYTHHGGDLNIDHALVSRAVLTATRPLPGSRVEEVLAFFVPSSSEWSFGRLERAFQPNVFVDVASTLEKKLRAMAAYEGEGRPFPHPRSPEALAAIARSWGSVAGTGAAEPFELVRRVVR